MSARPKSINRYAHEVPPFVSAELNADLDSDHPSEDALEWAREIDAARLADPRPRLTSDEVGERMRARHEARLRRDTA